MGQLTHHDLIMLLTAISVMLILSRTATELGRKIKIPAVMSEILMGILLGPTLFGTFFPDVFSNLFPFEGPAKVALDGITNISVIMLLFVAGLEVQLSLVFVQKKAAFYTSMFSMLIPFSTGFCAAWFFPEVFTQNELSFKLPFSLFMGTAMAISALPVIARILMDMNIFKTATGMLIITAAMFNDLTGWLVFAFILSMIGNYDISIWNTLLYMFGFIVFVLGVGKKIINKILPWIQTKLSWPGGVLSLCLGACFLCAAFTEYIGIHAILGAFIIGIAFGDSVHLHEKAREIIHQFVTNIFAPLFFVSIGLKVNFVENFNISIVVIVLLLAYFGKVTGAGIGAYLGGMSRNNALAVGFGMNARGAMEIIMGTLALNAGLINSPVFVALVVMALVTTLSSGPLMKRFIS